MQHKRGAANAEGYARIILEMAARRRAMDVANRLLAWSTDMKRPVEDTLADAAQMIEGTRTWEGDDDECVSLTEAIEHGVPPPEEMEPDVLIKGGVHSVYGDSEAGKTWFVLWLVIRAVSRGQRVLYYDGENGKRIVSERLAALGVDTSRLEELLRYVPFPSLSLDAEDTGRYARRLDGFRPDLVVFDSLSNYLGQAGCDENVGSDIENWSAAYTREARRRGITAVVLDHPGHDADRPRGSSRKKQEVDVMWRLSKTRQFGRDVVGEISLTRKKDRQSWLPDKVVFSAGGIPDGFVFRRSSGTVEEREAPDRLPRTERSMLEALRDFGREGARATEWQRAAEAEPYSIARPTFYRAKPGLVRRGLVVEDDRIYRVAEPPNEPSNHGLKGRPGGSPSETAGDTSTTGSGITGVERGDTSEKCVAPPETDGGLKRSHDGLMGETRPDDPQVSQVSHPHRGETVRPSRETSAKTESGVAPGVELDTRITDLQEEYRRRRENGEPGGGE